MGSGKGPIHLEHAQCKCARLLPHSRDRFPCVKYRWRGMPEDNPSMSILECPGNTRTKEFSDLKTSSRRPRIVFLNDWQSPLGHSIDSHHVCCSRSGNPNIGLILSGDYVVTVTYTPLNKIQTFFRGYLNSRPIVTDHPLVANDQSPHTSVMPPPLHPLSDGS